MANSCEFKTTEASTKSWLRTRNIIDKYLNILDLNKFRVTVTDLSNQARAKYGVTQRLFSETPDGKKAIPNKEAFKTIDNAKGIYYQTEGIKQSVADEPTLAKVKQAIEKMGVSLMTLSDYAKVSEIDTTGVNGLADLVKNIIAIAEGREHEALTEEMVHVATAALEQINPALVTELISKVDRFKVYKQTLEQYRNDPRYQLENGKPNIRKIKKEAADKLIAEVIINGTSDPENFPELMQPENRGFFQRIWDAILDFFRGQYRNSDISIFEEAANKTLEGVDTSTLESIGEGVYLQKAKPTVDEIYNTYKTEASKIKYFPATSTEKRYYTYDGKPVAKSVTESIKGDTTWIVSDFDRKIYDQKKDWGIEGHDFLEQYFTALIDDNGFARPEPIAVNIETKLSDGVQTALKDYAKELIASYKPGTRFLIESFLANTKVKGMLASKLDFVAIEPNDETGVKVDILDWKFTDIDKQKDNDVPWYKQDDWKLQMGEYSKMVYNLGLKPNQLRRTRMIPFVVKYNPSIKGDWDSPLKITGIEIGKVDNLKETKLYLMPVALDTESTGNKEIDALVESLNQQYKKLQKTNIKDKIKKRVQLQELSKAIRKLKMTLNFKPMVNVMDTFLKNAAQVYRDFENIDYDNLTGKEIEDKLGQLIQFKNSASKFIGIDKTFLSLFEEGVTDNESKDLLSALEKKSATMQRMITKFNALQEDYIVHLALKSGISAEDILTPEKPITSFIEKNFLEGTKLASNTIRLAQKLILKSRSLAKLRANELINQYFEKLRALEKEAASLGKDPFSLIGKVEDGNLSLVKKISKEFYEKLAKAKLEQDVDFFLENMDYEKYKEMADEIIESAKKELSTVVFSSDPEIDELQRAAEINKVERAYNIKGKGFNGFNNPGFIYLFKKSMLEDKFLSKDYKELQTRPAALAVWKFFTENLNRRAIDAGYLKDKGVSFFPLIEAAFVQKVSQTGGDVVGQAKEFFKDLYTINPNEEQAFAKWDPETRSVRKEIPKLFTRTNKAVKELSRDLTKVGVMWIESLMNYEENKLIENTLLTMHQFEKAKGQLAIDPTNGEILYKAGELVTEKDKSSIADMLEIIIDDALYGIREDEKSLGNVGLSTAAEKLAKDDETRNAKKVSIKKGFDNLNVLTQGLAVGLKALVAIPNYFGVNFQAFINSGNFYSFSEYLKNQSRFVGDTVGMPTLSTIEKGLIDMFIPLNEGLAAEKQRERALKEGKYAQWISSWSFNDVMMSTNSFPERKLQLTNALTMLQNTMLVDGKLVNIRQYVYAQDRNRYKMSYAERREIEATQEQRINELKKTKSLVNVAKIVDGKIVVDGLSLEEIAEYRNTIIEYGRDLSGQMNNDNKAGYRRDTIMKSFMMFKGWIPKQVSLRTLDINKDIVTGEWRYGRARLFTKMIADLGLRNIGTIMDVLKGTEKGLAYMDELLEAKKEAYKKKTGRELTITEEEFYDMVRKELSNQFKELGLLLSLIGLVFAAKAAAPDDDDDAYTKNRYKFWAKAINKIVDELKFYYDPRSIQSITSGNIVPQVGVLSSVIKALDAITTETYGIVRNDQELVDDNHVIKYVLDPIPIASQFQKEILPIIDPQLAKDLGIRVSEQARIMR